MILLFTAIFSTISIIEDRTRVFAGRSGGAGVPGDDRSGKTLGGPCWLSARRFFFFLATPFLNIHMRLAEFLYVLVIMFLGGLRA